MTNSRFAGAGVAGIVPLMATADTTKSESPPFCFSCGYDLRGIELPRPCPECGRLADPERQTAEAREWFARRWAWLWWFVRPSKVPPGVCYVLDDAASARLVRRRMFFLLWLPAVLTTLLVGAGSLVVIEYDVKIWYYDMYDPARKPLRVVTESETDRPYGFNLHLRELFFRVPANWVQVVERNRRRWSVRWYEGPDPLVIVFVGMMWMPLLSGHLPCRCAVLLCARRRSRRLGRPRFRPSVKAASSLTASPVGAAFWV